VKVLEGEKKMQAVTIVCVGKLKEGYWRDAAVEYQKRLSAFCRLSTVETVCGTDCRRAGSGGPPDFIQNCGGQFCSRFVH